MDERSRAGAATRAGSELIVERRRPRECAEMQRGVAGGGSSSDKAGRWAAAVGAARGSDERMRSGDGQGARDGVEAADGGEEGGTRA
jgi:hypothetical protein